MSKKGKAEMSKNRSLIRASDEDFDEDFDEAKVEKYVAKLRIDFIDDEITPHDIRGLLAKFDKVGDVSIYSGRNCTYALADMEHDAGADAADHLHGRRWRGGSISLIFANRARGRTWLAGHEWKPPKG
jgi:hypothetical protein